MAKDPQAQAKSYIDAALKRTAKPPTKAAYARAVRMAREAIEDLAQVAHRAGGKA